MAAERAGNSPEIGMQGDSLEAASARVAAPNRQADSSDFFEKLDQSVNGQIQDTQVTQSQNSGSNQVTRPVNDRGSNNVQPPAENGSDWKTRYQSSSKEAVKLKGQLNELKPFIPVLDAMKKDSGLVQHVRDYLMNGGAPAKSIQDKLNLPEDFQFDQNEAMTDPDSNSAKVLNSHVDGLVKNRVSQMISSEKQEAQKTQFKMAKMREAAAFKKKHNMTDEQWQDFVEQAKTRKLTMDDVYHLLNKEKANQNVANATKTDMLNQMKNVRSMPASASGANSQAGPPNPDSDIFDGILGLDEGVDNLFG
tara:strand:- start:837 stop:1757 length:921 start_codon:yes stop_codon:yes gene_type:complete